MSGKFKLITGLGNKDANKVKDLVLLWMEAGADIFDTSCSTLPYLQKACIEAGYNLDNFEFCVSIALEGDIHGKKAKIDKDKCKLCGKCAEACPEKAINPPFLDELKCIGCHHCKKVCKTGAISFYDEINNDLETLLKTNSKIDTVEIHISIKDKKEIIKQFKKIINLLNKNIKISVCLSRKYFSNSKTEKILAKLKELSKERDFVVQTDGCSMNGGKNDISGTIEAVSYGLFVKSLGYEIILSGGCNEFTAPLAKKCGLDCSIAFGSFARKLTEGIEHKEAVKIAKDFVGKTKEFIND